MKTKFGILITFLLSIQLSGYAQVKHAVTFGNHSERIPTKEENIYRIFMDMNGDYYPENKISDEELKKSGQSQLKIWAKKYPIQFGEIAKSYNLNNTIYSEENYSILQDSIRSIITNQINNYRSQNLTWIIHGFRKKTVKDETDGFKVEYPNSNFENLECRNRITTYLLNKEMKTVFIEVYWDGKYLPRGGLLRTIKLGFLFKNHAIPNAIECGYSLRKILNKIECQKNNFISHSTGTYVISNLLFNLSPEYADIKTPHQMDIRIALTASASPGKKLFKKYYNRNTELNYQETDNYSILNFINKNDFVLLKKRGFIKLPKLLGNTTLGCDYKSESKKLKEFFEMNFPNSTYSEAYNNYNGDHWFKSYTKSDGFEDVMYFLYK